MTMANLSSSGIQVLMQRCFNNARELSSDFKQFLPLSLMLEEKDENHIVRYNGRTFFILAHDLPPPCKLFASGSDGRNMYSIEYDMYEMERQRRAQLNQQHARLVQTGQTTSSATNLEVVPVLDLLVHILSASTPFHCLGVDPNDSIQNITTRFRKLSIRVHPDKLHHKSASAAFQALSRAYDEIRQNYQARISPRAA